MCRALTVLCAAPDAGSLAALKRAAVSQDWELVGGATSADEAVAQVEAWKPDVFVFFGSLGPDLSERVQAARSGLRTISIGPSGATATVTSLDDVRAGIARLPHPGGPVR